MHSMVLAERVERGRRAIALAKRKGLDTSSWKNHLAGLLAEAGREPLDEEGREPWMLWEWRRISIPRWQEILQVSIDQKDAGREAYARWMLKEILLDPEYEDPE